jgi:hypothetical protein
MSLTLEEANRILRGALAKAQENVPLLFVADAGRDSSTGRRDGAILDLGARGANSCCQCLSGLAQCTREKAKCWLDNLRSR